MLFWLPRSLSRCCEWPLLETQPSLSAVSRFNSQTCPVYIHLVHLKRCLCPLPVISSISEHVHLLNVCVEVFFFILQLKKKKKPFSSIKKVIYLKHHIYGIGWLGETSRFFLLMSFIFFILQRPKCVAGRVMSLLILLVFCLFLHSLGTHAKSWTRLLCLFPSVLGKHGLSKTNLLFAYQLFFFKDGASMWIYIHIYTKKTSQIFRSLEFIPSKAVCSVLTTILLLKPVNNLKRGSGL